MSAIYGNYSYSSYTSQKYGPSQATLAKYNTQTTYGHLLTGGAANVPSVNTDNATSLMGVKSAVDGFQSSISALTQTKAPTDYMAVSSNAGAVSVSQKPTTALMSKLFGKVELDVRQMATAQTNMGTALSSEDTSLEAGNYSFAIDSTTGQGGQRTSNYSVQVTEQDDALSVQRKMASAINSDESSAVRARVVMDEETGTSRLALEAKETGTRAEGQDTFQVRDTGSPGGAGLVEQMGVDSSDSDGSVKAQNAVYTVNGGAERTSMTNKAELAYGVTATFRSATEEAATISLQPDTSKAVDAAKNFVSAYNNLVDTAAQNGASSALSSLQSLLDIYTKGLSAVGISQNSDGTLSYDESALNRAAGDGSLNALFQGNTTYGLGAQLQQKAGSLSRNPMQLSGGSTGSESAAVNAAWSYGNAVNANLWNMMYSSLFGGQVVNSWV